MSVYDSGAQLLVLVRDNVQGLPKVALRYQLVCLQKHYILVLTPVRMNDLLEQYLILRRCDGQDLLDMLAPGGEIVQYPLVFTLRPKLLVGDICRLRYLTQSVQLKHLCAGQLDPLLAQQRSVLHCGQRGPSEIGEPVIRPYQFSRIQQVCQSIHESRQYLAIQRAGNLRLLLIPPGLRKLVTHDLTVGVPGHGVHTHPDIGYHILSQDLRDLQPDGLRVQLPLRLIVAAEAVRAAHAPYGHHDLPHIGAAKLVSSNVYLILDLTGLNAEPTQLDHVVGPSQQVDIAVLSTARPVAGAVPADAIQSHPLFTT